MSLALSTRALGAAPDLAAAALERARALGCRGLFLAWPWRLGAAAAQGLRAEGVEVAGAQVDLDPGAPAELAARLERALEEAARLRPAALVVDGIGAPAPLAAGVQTLARALHGPLKAGAPLAVRDGGGPGAWLAGEALEWLLSDLPGLGLWVDPARRHAGGEAAADGLDRAARRCAGVFVHARTEAGDGGHPQEAGVPWEEVAERLPTRVPWVLDLGASLSAEDARDALRYLRSLLG